MVINFQLHNMVYPVTHITCLYHVYSVPGPVLGSSSEWTRCNRRNNRIFNRIKKNFIFRKCYSVLYLARLLILPLTRNQFYKNNKVITLDKNGRSCSEHQPARIYKREHMLFTRET